MVTSIPAVDVGAHGGAFGANGAPQSDALGLLSILFGQAPTDSPFAQLVGALEDEGVLEIEGLDEFDPAALGLPPELQHLFETDPALAYILDGGAIDQAQLDPDVLDALEALGAQAGLLTVETPQGLHFVPAAPNQTPADQVAAATAAVEAAAAAEVEPVRPDLPTQVDELPLAEDSVEDGETTAAKSATDSDRGTAKSDLVSAPESGNQQKSGGGGPGDPGAKDGQAQAQATWAENAAATAAKDAQADQAQTRDGDRKSVV